MEGPTLIGAALGLLCCGSALVQASLPSIEAGNA